MDITAPQFRNRFIHTRYQALRKCCGCIHLRVGAGISCLIWMVCRYRHHTLTYYWNAYIIYVFQGLSMYFAILSFQNKSRKYYTHIMENDIALMLTCTYCSLLFVHDKCTTYCLWRCQSIISFEWVLWHVGLVQGKEEGHSTLHMMMADPLLLLQNRWFYVRLFSHATWTVLFMVLVDGFANAIYFITQRDEFMSWCINSSADTLNSAANVTGTSLRGNDYYNCDRLFQAEIKFGLFSTVLMIVLYVSFYFWRRTIYIYIWNDADHDFLGLLGCMHLFI